MDALLYGPDNKPVRSSKRLTREQATASTTSVRSPYEPIVASGLTPRRLQELLTRAKDGDHHDYLVLASEMEQRDAHYFSVLQTRKLAVQQLERMVQASSEAPEDVKVAEAVKSWLFSPAMGRGLKSINDAIGKGFSVTEIIWARTEELWQPVGLKHRPQRWFFFEREHGEELRLHNGSADGEPLEPFKYVLYEASPFCGIPIAGGLARIVAALHVFKGYAIKDWLAFAEVFGMPIRIGKYTPNASDDDVDELRAAVTAIGSDAAAVIPNTMEIAFERAAMSGGAGSDAFFMSLADWLNGETSKAVLGQTMTTEDGSSLAQAKVHNEVRKDILKEDAWQLANVIQRDIIVPFIDLNFGVRPRLADYPQFNFDVSEPEDLEYLARALAPFIDRGLRVSEAEIREKFGLSEPDAGETVLSGAGPAGADEEAEDEEDEDESEAKEEGGGNAGKKAMRAMLQRITTQARSATNMRGFRRELDTMLDELRSEK
jgi:phage gp29-like protein